MELSAVNVPPLNQGGKANSVIDRCEHVPGVAANYVVRMDEIEACTGIDSIQDRALRHRFQMIPSHVRNAQPRSAVGLEPFTSGVDQAEALPDALSALQPEKLHPETHLANPKGTQHLPSLQRRQQ